MARYLTLLSILVWPSKSCAAPLSMIASLRLSRRNSRRILAARILPYSHHRRTGSGGLANASAERLTVKTPAQPLRRSRDNGRRVGGNSRPSRAATWRAAKVGHGLCDHRDAGFNFNFHITGIAMEACSHALDVLGCVSHNRVPLRCLRALAPTRHRKFAFHANCLPSKAVVLIGSSERGVGAKEKTTARGRTNDSTFPKATRRGLRPRRQFQRGIFSPAPTHKESTWTTRPAKLGKQAFCPHCMA
jgi:hypothetical protein